MTDTPGVFLCPLKVLRFGILSSFGLAKNEAQGHDLPIDFCVITTASCVPPLGSYVLLLDFYRIQVDVAGHDNTLLVVILKTVFVPLGQVEGKWVIVMILVVAGVDDVGFV